MKEEAEELNAKGARKLPKVMSSGDEESWSEADDPSFDETSVKKPIIMKIKREEVQRSGNPTKLMPKSTVFALTFSPLHWLFG